ncbi:MAG: leucine--tRNA ligase, partial [bacterium]|nr:leucine--tRNA ligase [bacterium]
MGSYEPKELEAKWQKAWAKKKAWKTDLARARKPYFNLMMFPYPSAEGLHVGNVYAFTASDIHGRFKLLQGFDVFEPMGFDSFGIHSENFAIKKGTHPKEQTAQNIRHFVEQLSQLGALFDWDRAVTTSDPEYYKWTQWLFLKLFKNGLAYKGRAPVDWCPSCKTVLADEQVIEGRCERCETQVIQKELEQWFLSITKYADRMLKNLDWIDWTEKTKVAQRNWIGRSEGALLHFPVANSKLAIEVFTTRPDTLFGATYMVLAPEHPLVEKLRDSVLNLKEVEEYRKNSQKKSELERTELSKEKTGVELKGVKAVNPATKEEIPVFLADYVLASYGTGAIMAVPAHDERDFEFAVRYRLPIVKVVQGEGQKADQAYTLPGKLMNSGKFSGMSSTKAKSGITKFVKGKKTVKYHLRDWLISRQRYWGPPIPIVYCAKCGTVPVPEKDLPVRLPEVKDFRPTGTGKSPLASVASFVNTACPSCKGPAERETDVSDTFLDSAWYFFRYPSTEFLNKPFDKARTKKWLPVAMYIGGHEHAVLHLLYTRFITMALKDMGHIEFEEPFKRFRAHGLLTKEGAKMSK